TELVIGGFSTLIEGDSAVIASSAAAANSFVSVNGIGSSWQINNGLTVGNAGLGLLQISQGGIVIAVDAVEAAAGGGDGVIVVAGTGSALALTGSLTVGNHGAGELSILSGGIVAALDLAIGSADPASSGNVDVEGAGSRLFILPGGSLNIGVAGGGS